MKNTMTPVDIALALGVVILWGANFVVIKIGLRDLPPVLFTALRFVLAALPMAFFIKRPQTSMKLVFAYGMFQFAFQYTLLFTGIKLGLPAGLSSLVIQLQAFFTIGMAVLLLGERPRIVQLIGAAVAMAGMVLVASNLDGKLTLIGFVLVVMGGMSWAVANIITKKIGQVDPLALVVWGALVASPPLLVASYLMEGPAAWSAAAHAFSWRTLLAVLFQSYPNTLLGFAIWSMLMRRYAAATVAPFSLLVPVAGMTSAALLLGEQLQWWKICAGILVITGLALNLFGARLWASMQAARAK